MNRCLARCAALIASILLPIAANAQLFRAYVASYGSDNNPCTVDAPCRLLNTALNAVANGGEIWILDSANFNQGTLAINKSVSIMAVPGQVGSVLAVSNSPAITIMGSGIIVALRNLVITKNVANPGTDGIQILNASMVSVEDCVVASLTGVGIDSYSAVTLHISNTVFRDVGNIAIHGMDGPSINVTNSQLFQTRGIAAEGSSAGKTTTVNVTDSTIAGGAFGVVAITGPGTTVRVFVTRTTIHDVAYALYAEDFGGGGMPLVTVSDSTVAGVNRDVYTRGAGQVKSLGNNYIGDNLDGSAGTLTTTPQR